MDSDATLLNFYSKQQNMKFRYFLILVFLSNSIFAQKKDVSLENVWAENTFAQKSIASVNWMKSGGFYSALEAGNIVKNSIATGEKVETIFDAKAILFNNKMLAIDDYSLSADEQKILIQIATESIYRRSFKAEYFVYDTKTKTLKQLSSSGKQSYASFSPDGSKVAFVRANNLFISDLNSEQAITTTGEFNKIIHGSADWVYEEEFSFAQAFFWSGDGQKIAFYTFDESKVKEYNMQKWGDLYPEDYKFKYPKAGEANSTIEISVYDLASKATTKMDIGTEKDIYIPRINWTQDANLLSIRRMNRLQNTLEILHTNATTGVSKVILTEKSATYVDLDNNDNLMYLADDKSFITSSEQSGFKHLYLYDMSGKQIRQITEGNWEVADFYGIDEKESRLFFTSTEISPTERHLYCIGLNGKGKKKMSDLEGWNTANYSPDFQYYMVYNTSAKSPMHVSLYKNGTVLKVLEENVALKKKLTDFNIAEKSYFSFKTTQGTDLNAWMIKPSNFDATKKYPVLMFVYGGPGSQTVKNQWDGRDFFWYQVLASKGYIVVSVDNRGTGARGEAFKKMTYAQLGKIEVEDQIEGSKYLKTLPYIDAARVGIWGWSYGGYMTSLCMTVGAEHFKTGVAVAPVTTWRYYDTIYTERYLKTPQLNAAGYDDNSPITHAKKLKGNFLLIHGTGDDNVHYQNSIDFINALVKANCQFQSFAYPNRNHGIYGGNTRLHLYKMMTNFIEKNL
jgi:dipeptidyl-peptidase 4